MTAGHREGKQPRFSGLYKGHSIFIKGVLMFQGTPSETTEKPISAQAPTLITIIETLVSKKGSSLSLESFARGKPGDALPSLSSSRPVHARAAASAPQTSLTACRPQTAGPAEENTCVLCRPWVVFSQFQTQDSLHVKVCPRKSPLKKNDQIFFIQLSVGPGWAVSGRRDEF